MVALGSFPLPLSFLIFFILPPLQLPLISLSLAIPSQHALEQGVVRLRVTKSLLAHHWCIVDESQSLEKAVAFMVSYLLHPASVSGKLGVKILSSSREIQRYPPYPVKLAGFLESLFLNWNFNNVFRQNRGISWWTNLGSVIYAP